ncbi:MAG: hypothetical protein J6P61_03525 [Erysipelotrichaceae bacterium]|nr:hypothetical protein [Erysipelotrichaceae bacterium]
MKKNKIFAEYGDPNAATNSDTPPLTTEKENQKEDPVITTDNKTKETETKQQKEKTDNKTKVTDTKPKKGKKDIYHFEDDSTSSENEVKPDNKKQNQKKPVEKKPVDKKSVEKKKYFDFKDDKSDDSEVIGNKKQKVTTHTRNREPINFPRFDFSNLPEYWWIHAICIALLAIFVIYVLTHLGQVFYMVYVLAINVLDLSFTIVVILLILIFLYRMIFGRR